MTDQPHEIRIRIQDFDRSLLNAAEQRLEGENLRLAILDYLENQLKGALGEAEIVVTADQIILRWRNRDAAISLTDQGTDYLSKGYCKRGVALLEFALRGNPDDEDALYNLGMALSDQGRLEDAESRLRQLLELNQTFARGWVALGVLLARKGEPSEAIQASRRAVECDPEDGYARRMLGALLTDDDCQEEALQNLRRATELLPDDQASWLNLGKFCEETADEEGADEAYLKVLEINSVNQFAEQAKQGRSRLSERTFRDTGGAVRPDAVMYCLGALLKFAAMPASEVQKVTFEIVTLGMSGINPNDPDQKYTLRALPGDFSGLHLLCIEYVGFKILDPSVDIGFDLSKEYEEAKTLHAAK